MSGIQVLYLILKICVGFFIAVILLDFIIRGNRKEDKIKKTENENNHDDFCDGSMGATD